MCDLGIHALSQEPQPLRVVERLHAYEVDSREILRQLLGSFTLSFPYVGKEKLRLEPGRGVLHAFNT